MTITPHVPVDAPMPRGDRYGLIRVANGPITMPEHASGAGIVYRPISCGMTHDYPIVCHPDESPGESPVDFDKVFDQDDPLNYVDPFLVYSTVLCGSVGRKPADMRERVLLRFANGEPTGVERGFARSLAASGAPELSVDNPADIVEVIATLEQYIYGIQDVNTPTGSTEGAGYNHIAYIHATPRIAAIAASQHLVVDGSGGPNVIKYTPMGSIWVFGGGYSGAMPGAAAATPGTDAIWVTGQVSLWQAATPEVPPERETFNREKNQWQALAEREWVAAYDCAAAAVAFTYGTGSP